VGTNPSAGGSGTPFFSAVMLPVDAAKTSEKEGFMGITAA